MECGIKEKEYSTRDEVVYRGKLYISIDELLSTEANINHISVVLAKYRLSLGWSIEDTLATRANSCCAASVRFPIFYMGEKFSTVEELAACKRANAKGLEPFVIAERLRKGAQVVTAMQSSIGVPASKKGRKNGYNDNKTKINKEASDGENKTTQRRGRKPKEALETNKEKNRALEEKIASPKVSVVNRGKNQYGVRSVNVGGKMYYDIKDAWEHESPDGITLQTVYSRIRNGMGIDAAVRTPCRRGPGVGKEVIEEMNRRLSDPKMNPHNISKNTVYHRLTNGMGIEEAFSMSTQQGIKMRKRYMNLPIYGKNNKTTV